jgi:hypothetical protein
MIVIVLALMACVANTLEAGAILGPVDLRTRVDAYDTDRFRPISFAGGQWARVVVEGDGDTDLDLYVYDERGNLVASDDDSTDYCIARWFVRADGRYTIVVRNLGGVYNEYTLTID